MTEKQLRPVPGVYLIEVSVKRGLTASPFATFLSGIEGLGRNTHGFHIVLTFPIRLLGLDDSCLR